jgi:hypothetical protein
MKRFLAVLTVLMFFGCGRQADEAGRGRPGRGDTLQVEQAIAKADQLWESGQKADAVDAYTSLLYGRDSMMVLHRFLDGELPKIYRRTIDYKIEVGGLEAGRDDIEKALSAGISLSLSTPEANEFVAKVREERRERNREAAERMAQRSGGGGGSGGDAGKLELGMSAQQVEAIMGKPDFVQKSFLAGYEGQLLFYRYDTAAEIKNATFVFFAEDGVPQGVVTMVQSKGETLKKRF